MAYHSYDMSEESGTVKFDVAIEEFELSSFGESLAPAGVLEVINQGVVLETGKKFIPGTVVRIDFRPNTSKKANSNGEIVAVGYIRDVKKIGNGEFYRILVQFKKFDNEGYNTVLKGLEMR